MRTMKLKSRNAHLDSPELNRAWGHADAMADLACGRRNRDTLAQGQTFCLPASNPAYCDGYRAAWAQISK